MIAARRSPYTLVTDRTARRGHLSARDFSGAYHRRVRSLPRSVWQEREHAHRARLARYVDPHLERRRRRQAHPVHDFLFTYYNHRPSQLLQWHPGYGISCENGPDAVGPEVLGRKLPLVRQLHALLTATAARPPTLGCFGLHEWAMVYEAEENRHPWPLRLGSQATDEVVRTHRITCSHFDAFRFFTPAARPLNTLHPDRTDRPDFEQPGCLHASMDLYKAAFRLSPLICSDLVADCFELAWQIRILDMRAAPYDLSGLVLDPTGEEWTPVRIETPAGKQEYVTAQRTFAERAAPIRQHLIGQCEKLLGRSLGRTISSTSAASPRA